MRFESLAFERYGVFADRALKFHPDAKLHIVHGRNEAGKTSALSAIGDLLFGFDTRTDYDFKHDSRVLRIGAKIRHSDGRTVEFRRRKGTKNTLIDAADQPLPDDLLTPFLNGISREVFNREFGLTAEALRVGGDELLRAGGRLAETLAASSAGMTALSRVKVRLEKEADDLFTPRRSGSKPFYLALDRHDTADKALREATVTRETIQQLESAVNEAQEKLDALKAEHGQSGITLARWQRALRVRSKLSRLDGINVELLQAVALPSVDASRLAEWRSALEVEGDMRRRIAALDAADAADAEAIAVMAIDDKLLLEGGAIDPLRERLGAIRKANEELPRRRLARDQAEAALNDLARRLGLTSHAAVLEKLPTDAALAHVRDLIERLKRAEQALADAEARRTNALKERASLENEDSEVHALADSGQLKQRFDALSDVPAQADRLRRETAALKVETDVLAADAAALDPSPGPLDNVRELPLPDRTVIEKYAHAVELGEAKVKRLSDLLETVDHTITTTEAELTRLSRAGAVPSRADLLEARRRRDLHLDGLRAALNGDRDKRERELSAVTHSSQTIDRLTDLLLTDSERAALYDEAQQRLDESRQERARIAAKLAGLHQGVAGADEGWLRSWAASGIAPRSPAEMLRWRERIDAILNRLAKLDAQKASIEATASSLEAGKAAAIAFLGSIGHVPDPTISADILFREAKAAFDNLQLVWSEMKTRSALKRRIARDLAEAESSRDGALQSLEELRRAWPAAMTGIGQAESATTVQAEAALAAWHGVPVPKMSREREGRSVETMEADRAAFDHDVFEIVDRAAPRLRSESAENALIQLSNTLTGMRSLSESCRRLQEAGAQRKAERIALAAERHAVVATLSDASSALCGTDMATLPSAIEQLTRRQQLEGERAALQRELQEIADGRDEATLRLEQDGLDLDFLPGEIDRETVRQKQLFADINTTSAHHHQKQSELEGLLKGRDAGAAAAERAEANAELLSIAERWLLRSAASRLATRAIERHRARVQDPLIARANTLFAATTDGAFAGLAIDYDDDDQPALKAQRSGGERVEVAGLSEGTRDQLFLSLRLALLDGQTSEPLPFTGDDLLTSFDDDRTLATLNLLAAAGQQRQMILFTHHRYVVDLARSLDNDRIDIIAL